MSITTGSSEIYFEQPFDESTKQFYIGKPLTLVFSTNEGLLIKKWTVVDSSYSRDPIGNFQMTIGCLTNFWIDLIVPANKTINIYWAALYEGSYTAETLPPYVPKGKRVEMLNCGIPPQPRNLLDNSDFRIKNNIINTKGLTDYSLDSGDVFDRWRLHWTGDGRVSIKDGYIELYRETYCTYLFQHPRDLQSMVGKTYTVAAKVRYNGRIGWIDSTQRVDCGPLAFNDWDIATCTFTVGSATSDIGEAGIEISSRSNLSFEVQWVALYEGAYTKETLPAYLTKGKHVEMLNCNVPLAPHNLLDNSDFRNPVNQRGRTEASGNGYFIDRWGNYNGTSKVVSSGIQVNANKDSAAFLYQYIKALRDGTYTFAAKVNGNIVLRVIQISGATVTSINGDKAGYTGGYLVVIYANDDKFEFDFRVESGVTITVEWAALYEGSYDASTLPAYQPKGYAAELAECQRYFWRCNNTWFAEGTGCAFSDTEFRVSIVLPQIMRVTPTMVSSTGDTTSYGIKIRTSGKASIAPNAVALALKNNRIALTLTGNFTNGELGVLRLENAYLDFSADL